MANNAKIKAAGIDPVIQTYGDTWTSQLFVLADFANVTAAQPDWAAKYTANQAKYVDEPAIKGFQRLEAVKKAGYLNKDFASLKNSQGLQMLVKGTGAQYPMLTFVIGAYSEMSATAKDDIGFYAQPGDDAAKYTLTGWSPGAFYIPTSTTGAKLDAAKKFLAFVAPRLPVTHRPRPSLPPVRTWSRAAPSPTALPQPWATCRSSTPTATSRLLSSSCPRSRARTWRRSPSRSVPASRRQPMARSATTRT